MQFTTILSVAFAAATALAAPNAAAAIDARAAATTGTTAALPTAVPDTLSYSCKCATAAGVPNKATTKTACAATKATAKYSFAFNDPVGSCDARDVTSNRLANGLSKTAFTAACAKVKAGLVADCQ